MTAHKKTGRKTKNIVRTPATKLAHLRKRMQRIKRGWEGKR